MNKILVFLIFLISSSAFGIDTEATGFKIINGAGATEVDVHSDCQEVTNTSGSDQFVATKTAGEWTNFQVNLPTGMALSACAPACFGGGTSVGGYCWNLSAQGATCFSVCTHSGGYNAATGSYAGSSNALCEAVINAINGAPVPFGGSVNIGNSVGCALSGGGGLRDLSGATPGGSHPSFVRVCACNN